MSEKRFIYEVEPYHFPINKRIRDTQNNETYIYDLRELCELLNDQEAAIHSLEEEVRLLKPTNIEQYEQIVQLQEENEQLKKEYKIAIDEMVTDYKKLEKENRKLREIVNRLEEAIEKRGYDSIEFW